MDILGIPIMASADKLKEKQILMGLLKIPITTLEFSRFYCELYLNANPIGFLAINQSSAGIQYDISKDSLKKISWAKIYSLHQSELNSKIKEQIQLDSFHIIPSSFRRLYVEDSENQLIASFDCLYENFSWGVYDEKILAPALKNNSRKISG